MRSALFLVLLLGPALGQDNASKRAEALARANAGDHLSGSVIVEIVRVLVGAGDREAVETALRLGARTEAAAECARLLGELRADESVHAIASGLKDPELARYTASILAMIPTDEATEALLRALDLGVDRALVIAALKDRSGQRPRLAILSDVRRRSHRDAASAVRVLRELGFGNVAVDGAFASILDTHRYQDRIAIVDAVGPTEAPAVGLAVAALLEDRVWQVRAAAAEALRLIRIKDVVEPLIARLEREERPRVRVAIAEALCAITCEKMRDYGDLWRKWWDRMNSEFRVPDKPPKAKPRSLVPGERKTEARFYGIPVLSDRVVFVIDLSVSMLKSDGTSQTRFQKAVEELLVVVDKLQDGAKVNVIFFNSEVWRWQKRLATVTRRTRIGLAAELATLRPSGGTYLWDGLAAALDEEGVETIFLLSDGQPNGGRYTAVSDILRATKIHNRFSRATIHGVAIGTNSPILRALAESNAGVYVQR